MTLTLIKKHCTLNTTTDCWIWKEPTSGSEYARLDVEGKKYLAHRYVYQIYHDIKIMPENMVVRHLCNNKLCCNPEHLDIGTHSDNRNDYYKNNPVRDFDNNSQLAKINRKCSSVEELVETYLQLASNTATDCKVLICKSVSNGYPKVSFKNKKYTLSRLVLSVHTKIPYDDLLICRHTCHNKNCINPNHLIEGSRSDNSLDSLSYSKSVKLDVDRVLQIRTDIKNWNFSKFGEKAKFDNLWSLKFGVTPTAINYIRTNKTWKHVLLPIE